MATREQKSWQHYEEKKLARQIRKQATTPPKADRVRHKDWMLGGIADLDIFDELDLPERERVMPRGERERRQANLATTAVQPARADHREAVPDAAAEAGAVSSAESEDGGEERQPHSRTCRPRPQARPSACGRGADRLTAKRNQQFRLSAAGGGSAPKVGKSGGSGSESPAGAPGGQRPS